MTGSHGAVPEAAWWILVATLALILFGFGWVTQLFVRAARQRRAGDDAVSPAEYRWIILVPACNEEVTIGDSVQRLLALRVPHLLVLVIDDGSTDRTAQIVADLADPQLAVLRRMPPDARTGKSNALNAAWKYIHNGLLAGWDPHQVIVVVVDADGRLDPQTPAALEHYFADPEVGGVQAQVRIYNRRTPLTWFQELEFAIYGRLYQLGRSGWGIAGLGGNGQFNRLAALDAVADDDGPWRPFALTEDQDLGLRLVRHGWRIRHEWRVGVAQQGLNQLLPLWRQRTRWAQGNLQVMRQLPALLRTPVGLGPRIDMLWYLTMPIQQLIVALSTVVSILLVVFSGTSFLTAPLWALLLLFGLSFGSSLYGALARYDRLTVRHLPAALLLSVAYSAYTWLLLPSLLRACGRHLTRRGSWARTGREPAS